MTGRDILITLHDKYNGNWDKMYRAILAKEVLTEAEVAKAAKKAKYKDAVTIIDADYPSALKSTAKPLFVIVK